MNHMHVAFFIIIAAMWLLFWTGFCLCLVKGWERRMVVALFLLLLCIWLLPLILL